MPDSTTQQTISLLNLVKDINANLSQLKDGLRDVTNLGDRRTVPFKKLSGLIDKGGPLLDALKQVQQAIEGLETLAARETALERLSASSLDSPRKPLVYEPIPIPIHQPKFLPAYLINVFENTFPPDTPGLMYEATVDRLTCAFFTFYLPPTHQFLLQPQHTFRALAADELIALEGGWSIEADAGDDSLDPSAEFTNTSDDFGLIFGPPMASTPRAGRSEELSTEQFFHGQESFDEDQDVRLFEALNRLERQGSPEDSVSALPDSVRIDLLNRLVTFTRNSLQKPDLSVMYQNIPGAEGAPEVTISMAENKLRNAKAAIAQLRRYAKKYGRQASPRMRFFAFTLGQHGLQVAMFRFGDSGTDLVPIVAGDRTEVIWYSVCDSFVHRTMCELVAEVQTEEWSFQWAYETST
ncbi:hypothetical protein DFH08DRAFT_373956 [Mycena albidolilacea]|uniref:Uncharacterized protein n=1 Tax=Mycena albidolilacea TaxID=1033008 RepID=A0AAD7AKR1_9AGAR|nr:hypothetical protein DFH08DRAFT_373956 [Mycena albidolilacea]